MKLMLQLFMLISFLLAGVIFGIDMAEHGIYRINGTPDQKTKAFHITKVDQGELEISVLGHEYTTNVDKDWKEDIEKKKEEVASRISDNHLSKIGNHIGDWLTDMTRKGIDQFTESR